MNDGFWYAIGIISGLIISICGRIFVGWWYRPIVEVPEKDEDAWWNVETQASWSLLMEERRFLTSDIRAYRLKVMNKGKSALENATGTVEIPGTGERRICWYEGNQPSITINRQDHSFLDIYGVDLVQSNVICFPTENGWKEIPAMSVAEKIKIKLRITAKNASPHTLSFEIDPNNNCKPSIIC